MRRMSRMSRMSRVIRGVWCRASWLGLLGMQYAVCMLRANPIMVCLCYRSYIYVVVFILQVPLLVHWLGYV